jgi:hypothetical protein
VCNTDTGEACHPQSKKDYRLTSLQPGKFETTGTSNLVEVQNRRLTIHSNAAESAAPSSFDKDKRHSFR